MKERLFGNHIREAIEVYKAMKESDEFQFFPVFVFFVVLLGISFIAGIYLAKEIKCLM
jgi:hypothetical protein